MRTEIVCLDIPKKNDVEKQLIVPERSVDHHISNSDEELYISKDIYSKNKFLRVSILNDSLPLASSRAGESPSKHLENSRTKYKKKELPEDDEYNSII